MTKRFKFKSNSRPGVTYTTILSRRGKWVAVTCNCPGWIFHSKRSCRHTMKVLATA